MTVVHIWRELTFEYNYSFNTGNCVGISQIRVMGPLLAHILIYTFPEYIIQLKDTYK